MTPLEIIATIFAIFVLVKVFIVVMNPQLWMKVAGAALSNYILASVVYFILAVIVGYYIFASLDIAQVAAVMLFTALLVGLGLLPYSEVLLKIGEEISATRSTVFRKAWLPIVIWVAIAVWVLSTVFA